MPKLFKTRVAARAAAILLSVVMMLMFAAGCKPAGNEEPSATNGANATEAAPDGDGTAKTEGNPVVISSPALDFTLYDFRSAYYGSQDYMYMMYGMIMPEDYFNSVVNNCTEYLCVYNAAVESGITLADDDEAEINESFDEQLEGIISQYMNGVDSAVTDEAERRSQAIALLNNDLSADGLDYDTFTALAKNNLRVNKILDKYFDVLHDQISVSDTEVGDYIAKQMESADKMTMDDFRSSYEAYSMGQGFFPVYVPDECFSVNHILLMYQTSSDESGSVVYDKESTKQAEAEIEGKLSQTADFDAFMELEVKYGEDPGMDEEGFRENGYLIHGDFDYTYYEGFVYAAMNLYYGSWTPSPNPSTGSVYELPELKYFTLKDGTVVVKVATEPGVHYIIVNKTFTRGQLPYELGDRYWMSWSEAVKEEKFNDMYSDLMEGWKSKYNVTVYTDVFKAEFVAPENGEDAG